MPLGFYDWESLTMGSLYRCSGVSHAHFVLFASEIATRAYYAEEQAVAALPPPSMIRAFLTKQLIIDMAQVEL